MIKRRIASLLVALTFMIQIIIPANALTDTYPFNPNYKYQNGVSNVTVWLNYASGVGIWENYITQGVTGWMYTG